MQENLKSLVVDALDTLDQVNKIRELLNIAQDYMDTKTNEKVALMVEVYCQQIDCYSEELETKIRKIQYELFFKEEVGVK